MMILINEQLSQKRENFPQYALLPLIHGDAENQEYKVFLKEMSPTIKEPTYMEQMTIRVAFIICTNIGRAALIPRWERGDMIPKFNCQPLGITTGMKLTSHSANVPYLHRLNYFRGDISKPYET